MKPKKIGDQKLNADEQLQKFEEALSKYIDGKSLNPVQFKEEFVYAANLTDESMSMFTAEECVKQAYLLNGYSNYLQSEYNDNVVKLNFAKDNIRKIVASESHRFDKYTKHEMKEQHVVNENSFANRLDVMRKHAQARVDAMQDTIRDVRRMADCLMELSKRKQYS